MEPFVYAAPLLRQPDGMRMHYLPVPAEALAQLQAVGTRRVVLTINDQSYRRGVQGGKQTEAFILLGNDIMNDLGLQFGDTVFVELIPDPTPDVIDLAEFGDLLAEDAALAEAFAQLTPGYQRSLAYYVTSAKTPETRRKRALELARKVKSRTLYSPQPKG